MADPDLDTAIANLINFRKLIRDQEREMTVALEAYHKAALKLSKVIASHSGLERYSTDPHYAIEMALGLPLDPTTDFGEWLQGGGLAELESPTQRQLREAMDEEIASYGGDDDDDDAEDAEDEDDDE